MQQRLCLSMPKRVALLTGLLLSAMSSLSYAHYPFCSCKLDSGEIQCTGGFSDGSGAAGVVVDMISYDEEIIHHKKFNETSKASFSPYDGEFYILLDAGPGHTIEVDWTEIEGL